MWNDFSDYELCEIAAQYGLQDELEFNSDLCLTNRERIEQLVSDFEFCMAFSDIDANPKIVYN